MRLSLLVAVFVAACGDCPSHLPSSTVEVELVLSSTATRWVPRNRACATPLVERAEGGEWVRLETVQPFTCGQGIEQCPGPTPIPNEYLVVQNRAVLNAWEGTTWSQPEGCGQIRTRVPAGRYRFTVSYCRGREPCDAIQTLALPASVLCPATDRASVEVDLSATATAARATLAL